MRSSLVGLQLLLLCALVLGTKVMEERKECCGPGVPPEKDCCPPGETEEEKSYLETLEKTAEENRKMMQSNREMPYETMHLKQKVLEYFNKRSSKAFYRPIEDTDVQVRNAMGTMVSFTLFLVNTNCTRKEAQQFLPSLDHTEPSEAVHCVAVPKKEQKRVKCRFQLFFSAQIEYSAVVGHDCEPVVFWDGVDDKIDLDHLRDPQSSHDEHHDEQHP